MTDFLDRVVAERRADVAAARERVPEDELRAFAMPRARSSAGAAFQLALRARSRGGLAVIAEVKRVSPALGVLNAAVDPAVLALAYVAAGAAAISVLTEPRHWGGSLEDLKRVREAVDVPILCKDIIVSSYQLYEARAAGADAALLIAEALSDAELRQLVAECERLGMTAFVEAHEPVAFGRAVASGATVVGINARDLRDPSVLDVGRARQLHSFARPEQILVAESGIGSADDARLLPRRVDAVLVGTALMRAADPAPLIRGIVSARRTVSV